MATTNVKAVITAEDNASKVVKQFGDNVEANSHKLNTFSERIKGSFNALLGMTAGAGIALHKLTDAFGSAIDAANKKQNAMLGLQSVAKAFAQDENKATKAAESLAKDGLLSVGEAAKGLKNLLASGFNLDQATTLMTRFKDSAAFGRQGALSFGEAVASATEGIKNGNSILVDNAGVTKNLSVILEEAGFSAQDLMKATTDTNVRMAIFNGILKETNPQLGDAAKLSDTFAGGQAKAATKVRELKENLGNALQPALAAILEKIVPIIEKVGAWIEQHPKLAAAIAIAAAAFLGLITVLGTLALTIGGIIALVGGPFTAILLSIVAVMSAVIAGLIVSWDKIKAGFQAVKDFVVGIWQSLLDFIRSIPGAIRDALAGVTGIITAPFLAAFNIIKDGVDSVLRKLGLLKDQTFSVGIKVNADTSAAGAILKAVGRQVGGPVMSGSPYIVGEKGPELFVPSQSGNIIPNNRMGGAAGNLTIHVNVGMYAGTEMEKRRIAETLFQSLKDVANSHNTTLENMMQV